MANGQIYECQSCGEVFQCDNVLCDEDHEICDKIACQEWLENRFHKKMFGHFMSECPERFDEL